MEVSEKEQRIEAAKLRLNDRERQAYNAFIKTSQPEIAPSTQANMFQLFMQGKDCEAIRLTNPGFGLGQIAFAAVTGEWYKRREEHVQGLLDGVVSRVQQTQLESVMYVCDWISAHHVQNGEKLKRFFLTGNEEQLDGVPGNLRAYAEAINLLRVLTGQGQKEAGPNPFAPAPPKKVQVEVTEPIKTIEPVTEDNHAKIIEALEALDRANKK